MAKMFPKLTQTAVRIGVGDGREIDVNMLSLAHVQEVQEMRSLLLNVDRQEDLVSLRKRMIEIASGYLPEEFAEKLQRFPIEKLAELLCYLAYGDPDDDDQPVKKS